MFDHGARCVHTPEGPVDARRAAIHDRRARRAARAAAEHDLLLGTGSPDSRIRVGRRVSRVSSAQRDPRDAEEVPVAARTGVSRRTRQFDELAADPTFRDFVCMYIGEGYKRDRNRVSLANSDPAVVQLAAHWMDRLSSKSPGFSIQYHADQDLEELRRFWGNTVCVDEAAIRLQRKSNSNQLAGRTWRSRHGVLTITVDDTLLRARIEAWMHFDTSNLAVDSCGNGAWRSLVSRTIWVREIAGSNPAAPTKWWLDAGDCSEQSDTLRFGAGSGRRRMLPVPEPGARVKLESGGGPWTPLALWCRLKRLGDLAQQRPKPGRMPGFLNCC
jgi:hypothetical protein